MTYPFSPLVALVLAGAILAFARKRVLRVAGVALLVAGWLGCTPLVANLLVGAIESRADARADDCGRLDAVVLLAGGLQREPRDARDVQALNVETQQRVMAFLERDIPDLPLVIAGGGPYAVSEAELMRDFLHRIAPQRGVAMLETQSRTTWENALNMARLLPPPRRIALATGALHLPRARRAFETAGFTVCPWPLNRAYQPATGWLTLFPHTSATRKTEAVLHEAGGWLVYGWREPPGSGK